MPSVAIGLAQSLVLVAACTAFLGVGAPQAPYYAVLGLLLGLVMWPALAAVTASFSKSVESAQVAAMPLLLLSMLGSGTVVPLELMPDRLASVCELLPLTPVITLVRGGWTGTSPRTTPQAPSPRLWPGPSSPCLLYDGGSAGNHGVDPTERGHEAA